MPAGLSCLRCGTSTTAQYQVRRQRQTAVVKLVAGEARRLRGGAAPDPEVGFSPGPPTPAASPAAVAAAGGVGHPLCGRRGASVGEGLSDRQRHVVSLFIAAFIALVRLLGDRQ